MIELKTHVSYYLEGDPERGDTFEIGGVEYTILDVLPQKKSKMGRAYRPLLIAGRCPICRVTFTCKVSKSNLRRLRRTCEKHRGQYDPEVHG